jgi:hypothetical protein
MTTTRGIGLQCGLVVGTLLLAPGTEAGAALIALTASLSGAQETPPNTSPGAGSAAFILDDVNRILVSAVTFSNLTGTTTSADIQDQSGLILHVLPTAPTGVTQGSFTDIWTGLTADNIAALEAGNTSINIDTTAFPAGEIRGQITVVPEPGSLGLLGTGAVVLLGYAAGQRARTRAGRRG